MRVLVVGSVPVSVGNAADELETAGHEVVRCHEGLGPAFPCAALAEGRACPLEGEPVDVVLDVHDARTGAPSPYEDGATCGIRQHVPLVVAADGASAFEPWATTKVASRADLVRACEDAARAPLARHSELATEVAKEGFTRAGLDASQVAATVRRAGGTLKVIVTRPAASGHQQESLVMARVITALRGLDKAARGVDVSFV